MMYLHFIKNNIGAMAAANQPAAGWLASFNLRPDLAGERVFTNDAGIVDVRMHDGRGLFQENHPAAFYGGWEGEKEKAHASATLIVGTNIGYGLNHVLQSTPDSHRVVVIEPDPEMLLCCLSQTDYTGFIASGKLLFLAPERGLVDRVVQSADVQFTFGSIYLRTDIPSQQISPEYAKWSRLCRETLENFSVEMRTLRLKQDIMIGNELGNFRRAMRDGSVSGLAGTAQGLAAVILGAGPSLAINGPKLAEAPGYALYTTALQCLPAVQKAGIKPHLCMAIDFNESMMRVYDRLDREWAKDIPLIYSTKVHPEVVENYPGPTLPIWTRGGLGTFVFNREEKLLDAAGNVSVALYRFLEWCGVDRVLLVGQDYAWKDDASHAPGHHANYAAKQTNVFLPGRDGEELRSAMPYVAAVRDLERDIGNLGVPTYNLYGGGALIKGTLNVDIAEVYSKGIVASVPGSHRRFMEAIGRSAIPRPVARFEARTGEWTVSLKNAQKRLEKLFRKSGRNHREIRETLANVHAFMRQDPLYLPYLYNEILDVAGLLHTRPNYAPRDLSQFKSIIKRVRAKVRRMDEVLAAAPAADAA